MGQPGRRIQLENQCAGISIDDQPRQTVVLTVHKPVAAGFPLRRQVEEWVPEAESSGQLHGEPILVDGGWISMMKDPHTDRGMRVIQSDGKEALFAVEDDRQIAGLTGVALAGDGLLEEPGMPLAQGAFRLRGDTHRDALCVRLRQTGKARYVELGLGQLRVSQSPKWWRE